MIHLRFNCDVCGAVAEAKPPQLPPGWYARGPSNRDSQSRQFCSADCSIRYSESLNRPVDRPIPGASDR